MTTQRAPPLPNVRGDNCEHRSPAGDLRGARRRWPLTELHGEALLLSRLYSPRASAFPQVTREHMAEPESHMDLGLGACALLLGP